MKLGFVWKPIVLAVALAPAAVLTGCKTDGDGGGGFALAEPVSIQQQVTGSSEVLDTAQTFVVTNQADWDAGNYGEVVPGDVDFSRYDVVVVALGEKPTAGYWVRITAIQQVGTELAVQFTANSPAEDAVVATVVEYPYHAVLVPKTGATLAVADPTFVTGEDRP